MIISSEAKKTKLVLTFSDDDANYSQGTTIDSAPDSKTIHPFIKKLAKYDYFERGQERKISPNFLR